MADKQQIQTLQGGVEIWNRWRHDHPEISVNLRDADIEGVDLSGIDFSEASLIGANLRRANLTGANLYHADFTRADLSSANLSQARSIWVHFPYANLGDANFSNANLLATEFVDTNLRDADLSGATIGATKFENTDLSVVNGLDRVIHKGPSHVGIDTIYRSNGNIPGAFLRGAGILDSFIIQIPSLVGALQPIQFYSCFISYSTDDERFARRLYSRMRAEDLRVWFAPEDIKGGQKLYDQIEHAIQMHDRLLLVLSESSMKSEWVITEIRNARRVELEEKRRKLFPIRLVNFERVKKWERFDAETGKDLGVEIREYFIPDFSNWEEPGAFEEAFKRLLRDLKAEE